MKRTVIEWIVDKYNIDEAIERVKQNKGAPGIDKMTVEQLDSYFSEHRKEIIEEIRNGTYKPSPVRRTYIPKTNGSLRPLGIPTVVDRVVQQAIAQVLMRDMSPNSVIIALDTGPTLTAIWQWHRRLTCSMMDTPGLLTLTLRSSSTR